MKSSRLREVWDLIVAAATFFLFACQPNMTVPAAVNATRSEQATAANPSSPADEAEAPEAAAPAPAAIPAGGGAEPVDGPVDRHTTARESGGGTVSSPSTHERIIPGYYLARVIGWPGMTVPPWRKQEIFLAKLEAGDIDADLIRRAKVQHFHVVTPTVDDPQPLPAGYYLVFWANNDCSGTDYDETLTALSSVQDLKNATVERCWIFDGDRFLVPWNTRGIGTSPSVPQGTVPRIP